LKSPNLGALFFTKYFKKLG